MNFMTKYVRTYSVHVFSTFCVKNLFSACIAFGVCMCVKYKCCGEVKWWNTIDAVTYVCTIYVFAVG